MLCEPVTRLTACGERPAVYDPRTKSAGGHGVTASGPMFMERDLKTGNILEL